MIPSALACLILAAAAWRTWQLVSHDDLTEPIRLWLFQGDRHPAIEDWLTCPYCAGFWIALAWVTAWWITGEWALAVALPFAISAALISIAELLSTGE